MKPSEVTPQIRELIVHLHRGNGKQAQEIVDRVAGFLTATLSSGADPTSETMHRAEQTMFAMDEVRISLAERNFNGAMVAARDAVKEWK